MTFSIDPRITSTCFELGDWPLCRIFLKDNANYPWFILVPRHENAQEIHQLPVELQYALIKEISSLSRVIQQQFKPDKLNVGALGNIVPQLHIHIIARFTHDDLWPQGIWQDLQQTRPYETLDLECLLASLGELFDF